VLATDAAGAGRITLRDVVDGDTTGACSHGTRPIRWRPPVTVSRATRRVLTVADTDRSRAADRNRRRRPP
jgi:hypothetical protein